MKQSHSLEAHERTRTGKGGARKVRAEGLCPAVLYGKDVKSRAIQVDPRALQRLIQAAGENALIDLTVKGEGEPPAETLKVIIRHIDFSPLGMVPEHIDFYHVSLDRAITVSVPLELTGSCEAVENRTGTVSQLVHELSIECLPTEIPEHIEVDVSGLKLGHSLHVSDLTFPSGVTVLEDAELAVVSLNPVKEVEEEEEVAPELETAEPELVKPQKEGGEED